MSGPGSSEPGWSGAFPPWRLSRSTRGGQDYGGRGFEALYAGAGRHQMTFAAVSALMGGSVRVGSEDSLYLSRANSRK